MLSVCGKFQADLEDFVNLELEWFGELKNGGLILADASCVDGPAAAGEIAIDGGSN